MVGLRFIRFPLILVARLPVICRDIPGEADWVQCFGASSSESKGSGSKKRVHIEMEEEGKSLDIIVKIAFGVIFCGNIQETACIGLRNTATI